jgi:hypothetical protein
MSKKFDEIGHRQACGLCYKLWYAPVAVIYDRRVRFSFQHTFMIVNLAVTRFINYISSSTIYDQNLVYSTGHCGYNCKLLL